jgi:hypothetical protein
MGGLAVETLIDIIAHAGAETRHILIDTELVIRSSCGTLKSTPEGGDDKKKNAVGSYLTMSDQA